MKKSVVCGVDGSADSQGLHEPDRRRALPCACRASGREAS
jgi:hypothetical protein